MMMSGSHFNFVVNDQQVATMDDSTYAQGVSRVENDDTDFSSRVIFTNFSIAQPTQ